MGRTVWGCLDGVSQGVGSSHLEYFRAYLADSRLSKEHIRLTPVCQKSIFGWLSSLKKKTYSADSRPSKKAYSADYHPSNLADRDRESGMAVTSACAWGGRRGTRGWAPSLLAPARGRAPAVWPKVASGWHTGPRSQVGNGNASS